MSLISLKSINKYFRIANKRVCVLSNVTFNLSINEIIAIVGPSGSGKTSLLRVIGLLDNENSGKVLFNGLDCNKINDRKKCYIRNSYIGFIFQSFNLLAEFNVVENIIIPQILSGKSYKKSFNNAYKFLKFFNINYYYHYPNQLSGGQQQKVAIIRSIANRQRLLLVDEPTGNLDKKNGDMVINLLLNIINQFRISIILVTHNIDIANKINKIYNLKSGKLKVF